MGGGGKEQYIRFLKENDVDSSTISIVDIKPRLTQEEALVVRQQYQRGKRLHEGLEGLSSQEISYSLIKAISKGIVDPVTVGSYLDCYLNRVFSGKYPDELLLKAICGDYNLAKNNIALLLTEAFTSHSDTINTPIDRSIYSDAFKHLLSDINCACLNDLLNYPDCLINLIFSCCNFRSDRMIAESVVRLNVEKFLSRFENTISDLLGKFKKKYVDILIKRTRDNQTLEAIGLSKNLTRERVRQIELTVRSKLLMKCRSQGIIAKMICSVIQKGDSEGVCSYKDIEDGIGSAVGFYYFLLIYKMVEGIPIIAHDDFHCFAKEDILAVRIEEAEKRIGLAVAKNNLTSFSDFECDVVRNNYCLKNQHIYVLKGKSITDLYLDLIDRYYPGGFKFSDQKNVDFINEQFEREFGQVVTRKPDRILQTYLSRAGYLTIDRGVYLRKDLAYIDLPDALVKKVFDYIKDINRSAYYSEILARFSVEFNNLGIKNWFYLKSVLDLNLPQGFEHKRDYIKMENALSPRESITKKALSFAGEFTLDELKSGFVGVEDYVFSFVLDELNQIVSLGNRHYIAVDHIGLSAKEIADIRTIICDLIKREPLEFVTSNNVFGYISLFRKDIYSKLPFYTPGVAFASLCRSLFSDIFIIRGNLISNSNSPIASFSEALILKFGGGNLIKVQDVKDYINHRFVRYTFTEIALAQLFSQDFVTIDEGVLVNKKTLALTDDEIGQIRDVLNFRINSWGPIDVDDFKAYGAFPTLKYPWNKFLLVGIVISYLSEYFVLTAKKVMRPFCVVISNH